jgi:hypothetical protein
MARARPALLALTDPVCSRLRQYSRWNPKKCTMDSTIGLLRSLAINEESKIKFSERR